MNNFEDLAKSEFVAAVFLAASRRQPEPPCDHRPTAGNHPRGPLQV